MCGREFFKPFKTFGNLFWCIITLLCSHLLAVSYLHVRQYVCMNGTMLIDLHTYDHGTRGPYNQNPGYAVVSVLETMASVLIRAAGLPGGMNGSRSH